MTSRTTFDYDAFVREYRAVCKKRGIDPKRGATVYQAIHVAADCAYRRRPRDRSHWWQRHEVWLDCPPYRSDTEADAFWHLFLQAYAITLARLARQMARKARHASGRQSRLPDALPLRELHQRESAFQRSR